MTIHPALLRALAAAHQARYANGGMLPFYMGRPAFDDGGGITYDQLPAGWRDGDPIVPAQHGASASWGDGMSVPQALATEAGNIGRGVVSAVTLPGDVYAGRTDPMSDAGLQRALSLAGMVPMAGMPMAEANALGAGGGRITAYHGSPHNFDAFDASKIGTGEGAQAYGHGLYFAGDEGVANSYRKNLSGPSQSRAVLINGNPVDYSLLSSSDPEMYRGALEYYKRQFHMSPDNANDVIKSDLSSTIDNYKGGSIPMDGGYDDAISAMSFINKYNPQIQGAKRAGHMYEVGINSAPEHFLDYDAPLNAHDPATQAAIVSARFPNNPQRARAALDTPSFMEQSGSDILSDLQAQHGAVGASEALKKAGVPGIRYLDAGSRAAGDGSRNYVVFDAKNIDLIRKYGLAGVMAGGGGAAGVAAMAGSDDQHYASGGAVHRALMAAGYFNGGPILPPLYAGRPHFEDGGDAGGGGSSSGGESGGNSNSGDGGDNASGSSNSNSGAGTSSSSNSGGDSSGDGGMGGAVGSANAAGSNTSAGYGGFGFGGLGGTGSPASNSVGSIGAASPGTTTGISGVSGGINSTAANQAGVSSGGFGGPSETVGFSGSSQAFGSPGGFTSDGVTSDTNTTGLGSMGGYSSGPAVGSVPGSVGGLASGSFSNPASGLSTNGYASTAFGGDTGFGQTMGMSPASATSADMGFGPTSAFGPASPATTASPLGGLTNTSFGPQASLGSQLPGMTSNQAQFAAFGANPVGVGLNPGISSVGVNGDGFSHTSVGNLTGAFGGFNSDGSLSGQALGDVSPSANNANHAFGAFGDNPDASDFGPTADLPAAPHVDTSDLRPDGPDQWSVDWGATPATTPSANLGLAPSFYGALTSPSFGPQSTISNAFGVNGPNVSPGGFANDVSDADTANGFYARPSADVPGIMTPAVAATLGLDPSFGGVANTDPGTTNIAGYQTPNTAEIGDRVFHADPNDVDGATSLFAGEHYDTWDGKSMVMGADGVGHPDPSDPANIGPAQPGVQTIGLPGTSPGWNVSNDDPTSPSQYALSRSMTANPAVQAALAAANPYGALPGPDAFSISRTPIGQQADSMMAYGMKGQTPADPWGGVSDAIGPGISSPYGRFTNASIAGKDYSQPDGPTTTPAVKAALAAAGVPAGPVASNTPAARAGMGPDDPDPARPGYTNDGTPLGGASSTPPASAPAGVNPDAPDPHNPGFTNDGTPLGGTPANSPAALPAGVNPDAPNPNNPGFTNDGTPLSGDHAIAGADQTQTPAASDPATIGSLASLFAGMGFSPSDAVKAALSYASNISSGAPGGVNGSGRGAPPYTYQSPYLGTANGGTDDSGDDGSDGGGDTNTPPVHNGAMQRYLAALANAQNYVTASPPATGNQNLYNPMTDPAVLRALGYAA